MYSADGALLYIGCTVDMPQRIQNHIAGTHWIIKVARIDLEWHPDFETGRAAEGQAIAVEDPRYNVLDGTGRRRQRSTAD